MIRRRYVTVHTASNFEPIILTPVQAFATINQLELMLRTLVLVTAATALQISEILALQWGNIDSENQCIYVRRAYVYGKFCVGPTRLYPDVPHRAPNSMWQLSSCGSYRPCLAKIRGRIEVGRHQHENTFGSLESGRQRRCFVDVVAREGVDPPTPAFSDWR